MMYNFEFQYILYSSASMQQTNINHMVISVCFLYDSHSKDSQEVKETNSVNH